jgi:NADPH2:quinone reductase
MRSKYQEKPKLPFVPGGEVSGTVAAVGSAVRGLAVGDAVLAVLPRFGGFAEEVRAAATDVFPLPPVRRCVTLSRPSSSHPRLQGLELVPAAGLAVAYGTAHVALEHRCGVKAGTRVLVLGAAGGVGLAAVQVARALGARVAAVARGPTKVAALRAEGAEVVIDADTIDYKRGGLKAALQAADANFAPRGVDCVFDPVGGKALTDAIKCLAVR